MEETLSVVLTVVYGKSDLIGPSLSKSEGISATRQREVNVAVNLNLDEVIDLYISPMCLHSSSIEEEILLTVGRHVLWMSPYYPNLDRS